MLYQLSYIHHLGKTKATTLIRVVRIRESLLDFCQNSKCNLPFSGRQRAPENRIDYYLPLFILRYPAAPVRTSHKARHALIG